MNTSSAVGAALKGITMGTIEDAVSEARRRVAGRAAGEPVEVTVRHRAGGGFDMAVTRGSPGPGASDAEKVAHARTLVAFRALAAADATADRVQVRAAMDGLNRVTSGA